MAFHIFNWLIYTGFLYNYIINQSIHSYGDGTVTALCTF